MSGRDTASDFWVITAYYNPVRWRSRLANYRVFRRELCTPLLTIEWDSAGQFELESDDAELLLRQTGGDTMWQKERLLGIALAALPAHVRYVAWLDCDVVFPQPRWFEKTRELLQRADYVQPFRRVTYLDATATQTLSANESRDLDTWLQSPTLQVRPSFLDLHERAGADTARVDLTHRFDPAPGTANQYHVLGRPAYGHAWAARVEALRMHGWYERCVIGGGDLLFAYGVIGQHDALIENHHSVGWDFYGSAGYRRWADALTAERHRVACGEESMLHLFHGTLADRQYRSRIDGLARFALDVDRDLSAAPGEPWAWARQRAELNAYVLEYLRNRREDP